MSLMVDFTVADEAFLLGQVLAYPPSMHIEVEKIVPAGSTIVPYLWIRGEEYDAFEQRVRENEAVTGFTALDRLDDWILYRIEWVDTPYSLLEGIETSDGVILEATGNDGWLFRVRFPNHDAASQFYNYCTEQEIPIHIERSYTLTEKTEFGHRFDLSQPQREALVLGLRRGYFDTPSQTSLSVLADELDISEQALSNRIRRGTEKVLREALLSSATDFH